MPGANGAAQSATTEDLAFAQQLRERYLSATTSLGHPEKVGDIRDFKVAGQNPDREIPVRLYLPEGIEPKDLPVVVFAHGGGFMAGNLDMFDVALTSLTNRAGAAILSVDYRLIPEHPYPAGLEDVYAALSWVATNGASIGIDPQRIAISGDSAGGNLAAAAAILTRDRRGPKLSAQLLMYPGLGNKMDTPSFKEFGQTHTPTVDFAARVLKMYVPAGVDPFSPLISPLSADHRDLPPALVLVGRLDPLRDDGQEYSKALNEAGVEAQTIIYPNSGHAFIQFYQLKDRSPDGDAALADGAKFLGEKLALRKRPANL